MTLAMGRFVLGIAAGLARITGLAWLAGAAINALKAVAPAAVAPAVAAEVPAAAGAGFLLSRALFLARWAGPAGAFFAVMHPSATQSGERGALSVALAGLRSNAFGPGDNSASWMMRNFPGIRDPINPLQNDFLFKSADRDAFISRMSGMPSVGPGGETGKIQVNVDFSNLPQGATVHTESSGNARAVVRLDTGLAFSGMP
jgi:hypothetical protein